LRTVAVLISDPDDDDSNSTVLRVDDSFTKIVVAGEEISLRDAPFGGERHEISVDQGIDALLLVSGVEATKAQFEIGELSNIEMVLGRNSVTGSVVPISSKQWKPTVVRDKGRQGLQESGGIDGEFVA
jgi:hypothetical protein